MTTEKRETMQTPNTVVVTGLLKQVDLEIKKDKNKETVMSGRITVQYGDKADQLVQLQVYRKKLTGKGEEAKAYTHLKTIKTDGVTVDKATEENPATIVSFYGRDDFTPKLELNEYVSQEGKVNSNPQVKLGYGNVSVNKATEDSFKSEFDLVLYLNKDAKKEEKNDEETGRLLIEGFYVDFNNQIKPLQFVVEDEELVEGMEDLEKGELINIWGDIKIASIVTVKEKKSGFGGKAKTEETRKNICELLIKGGEGVDEIEGIDDDFIKTAYKARQNYLEELKNGEPKSSNKSKGKGSFSKKDKSDMPF